MLSETLLKKLREYPERQFRVAALIGVSGSCLSHWVRGSHRVRNGDPRIVLLGEILGVPAAECFTDPLATPVPEAALAAEATPEIG
jgi:hypothetical protein